MKKDRIGVLIVIMLAVWGALIARTFQIQVVEGNIYENQAENQSQRRVIWTPDRGPIVDRNLDQLAVNQVIWAKNDFVMKRLYPEGRLASQILGFMGKEGKGLQGLEYFYEEKLRGIDGWSYQTIDSKQRALPGLERKGRSPTPGMKLVLTLDRNIQEIAETALAKSVARLNADRASAIVVDPNTGEILAMAAYPNFDPNSPQSLKSSTIRNDALSLVYEPGSTFKLITACAALEEQTMDPNQMIDGEGGRLVLSNGEVIRDTKEHGLMNMTDAMAYSSNVAFAKIARSVGNEKFYRIVRSFGFGSPTLIELPGEESGYLKPPHKWSGRTLLTMAMGHEIMVTPLQMAMAFSAVANGGELLMPRIVKEWRNPETNDVIHATQRQVVRRVISQETASLTRAMMREVVLRGTAKNIKSEFLDFAGKTGTAEKYSLIDNKYDRNSMVSSFIGMVPANNPRYVAVVVVDEPRTITVGGLTAGPVFREILERIYMHPESSPLQYNLAQVEEVDPCQEFQYIGLSRRAAEEMSKKHGCRIEYQGKGTQVVSQQLSAVVGVKPGMRLVLGTPVYKQMPDLRGLPLRDALEVLGAARSRVEVAGKGWVTEQQPAPDMPLQGDQKYRLVLKERS